MHAPAPAPIPSRHQVWHQSEARTAATVWNWSGKTLSPGALLAVLYFSSCHIFFRPFRLFLVPTICPYVSEDDFGVNNFNLKITQGQDLKKWEGRKGVPSPHTLARSHHPRFSQAQGRGQIIDHFDPDLMRTCQTQYGILFIIGLRRAGIEN